jgi:hypothetical protein
MQGDFSYVDALRQHRTAGRDHATIVPNRAIRLNAADNGRSAATRPSTSARCGTVISTTAG